MILLNNTSFKKLNLNEYLGMAANKINTNVNAKANIKNDVLV